MLFFRRIIESRTKGGWYYDEKKSKGKERKLYLHYSLLQRKSFKKVGLGELKIITLVPYCAAKVRVTVFPKIED